MKLLMFFLAAVSIAGCAGYNLDTAPITQCMVQCAETCLDSIPLVSENGDTIWVQPKDYSQIGLYIER